MFGPTHRGVGLFYYLGERGDKTGGRDREMERGDKERGG